MGSDWTKPLLHRAPDHGDILRVYEYTLSYASNHCGACTITS